MNPWQRLLFVFTAATDDQRVQQLQYSLIENQILRAKLPQRITVTPQERRRLLRFGKPLGAAIRQLITIVSPQTFLRWVRQEKTVSKPARIGRPRTAEDIRLLVIRLATENPTWGYDHIHGELVKLGLASICVETVGNILKAEGIEPAPQRGQGTWHDFVNRHAETLWACDFFTQKIFTMRGAVDCFVFFFIHIQSRRVYVAGMTTNPTHAWVAEQAQNFCRHVTQEAVKPTHLIRDFDGKFGIDFDAALAAQDIKVLKVGPRRPLMNCYAERWVGSIRRECLNHFIVLGERYLRYLVDQYVRFYNIGGRPHQGVGNVPLAKPDTPPPPAIPSTKNIIARKRLGGLLNHYYHRRAA